MLVSHSNFDQAIQILLNIKDYLVVDLETTGLKPYHGDRICGIAIGQKDQRFYFPFRHEDPVSADNLPVSWIKKLYPILTNPDIVYVGWNYKFDLQFLYMEGFELPNKIEDIMLAAHLQNENEYELVNGKVKFLGIKPKVSYQLKRLSDKYLNSNSSLQEQILIDKILNQKFASTPKKAKGAMWKLPASDVAPYAIDDIRLTEEMRDFYIPHLKNWLLYDIYLEVNRYSLITTKAEINGLPLDVDLIKKYIISTKSNINRLKAEIDQIAGYAVNPNSPKQLCNLLGVPSSRAEILTELTEKGDPIAKLISEYRQWSKVANTYYQKYLDEMDDNRKIHTSLHLTGTVSGRLSSSNPNLQAIPRKTDIYKVKDVFVALPDHYFVQADYSQAEMRLGVHYANEEAMKEKIIRGADLHTETANELGIPRDAAKRINFGVIYGIGKVSLATQLKIDEKLAGQYLNKYHKLYPGFRQLYKKCEAMAEQRGYIRMWTGRVRRYDTHNPAHKAMSNLIQGGVAEMMRVVITTIDEQIPEVQMCLQVHDSIVFQVPKENYTFYLDKIRKIMEEVPQFSVPMLVDIEYGESWGTTKQYKGGLINE